MTRPRTALVIGGGVIGCALLRELAGRRVEAVLVEAEADGDTDEDGPVAGVELLPDGAVAGIAQPLEKNRGRGCPERAWHRFSPGRSQPTCHDLMMQTPINSAW